MSGRKHIDIIVNPAAGSRNSSLLDDVVRRLKEAHADVRCMETQCAGHATELAAAAAAEGRADVIVAAGGDGTINEVARGLLGCRTPLGVMPLGTANVLAMEIGQDRSAAAIADALLFGEARPIGMGFVGDGIFLLMVGVGFDGALLHALKPAMKRRLGKFALIWEGLKRWVAGPGEKISLKIDGVDQQAAWVVVTNSRHYAGPYTLSRTTDIFTPGLEVFLFRRGSRLAFAGYFLGLALGRVRTMPGVDVVTVKKVEFYGPEGTLVEVDGDASGQLPLTIERGDQLLRLVIPRC